MIETKTTVENYHVTIDAVLKRTGFPIYDLTVNANANTGYIILTKNKVSGLCTLNIIHDIVDVRQFIYNCTDNDVDTILYRNDI